MGLIQTWIKKLNKKHNLISNDQSQKELKPYTRQELDNAQYIIDDVYRVTLTRKLKTKNIPEPKKEVKSILAIHIDDEVYMDIETGEYYRASRFISDLNQVNVWTAYEMPFKYYVCETLLDKHIDYDESFTAQQFRELVRIQKQKYNYPMYEPKKWGVNK